MGDDKAVQLKFNSELNKLEVLYHDHLLDEDYSYVNLEQTLMRLDWKTQILKDTWANYSIKALRAIFSRFSRELAECKLSMTADSQLFISVSSYPLLCFTQFYIVPDNLPDP